MHVKDVGVELGWGSAEVSGSWELDTADRDADWKLYVELVTQISAVPLRAEHGVLREALTSLHELFGALPEIMRRFSTSVARPVGRAGHYRFSQVAIWMLNTATLPVFATWDTQRQRWETSRRPENSIVEHEDVCARAVELCAEIEALHNVLLRYARILAGVCETSALIDATHEILAAQAAGPST